MTANSKLPLYIQEMIPCSGQILDYYSALEKVTNFYKNSTPFRAIKLCDLVEFLELTTLQEVALYIEELESFYIDLTIGSEEEFFQACLAFFEISLDNVYLMEFFDLRGFLRDKLYADDILFRPDMGWMIYLGENGKILRRMKLFHPVEQVQTLS